MVAATNWKHAAVVIDPAERTGAEQLRLAHELHAAADERPREEVVHERCMVRREYHRPVWYVLAAKAAGPEADQRVQDRDHPGDFVDRLRLVIAHPLVEGVEKLLRARVLVDLRL